MLNLNKHTQKKKSKPKPTCKIKNCSHVCAHHCTQVSYTTQHRTVLIITALMQSIGEEAPRYDTIRYDTVDLRALKS